MNATLTKSPSEPYPKFSRFCWRNVYPHHRPLDYAYGHYNNRISAAVVAKSPSGVVYLLGYAYRKGMNYTDIHTALSKLGNLSLKLPPLGVRSTSKLWDEGVLSEQQLHRSHHSSWFFTSRAYFVSMDEDHLQVVSRMLAYQRVMTLVETSQVGRDVFARAVTQEGYDETRNAIHNTGLLSWFYRYAGASFSSEITTGLPDNMDLFSGWPSMSLHTRQDFMLNCLADDIMMMRGHYHTDAQPLIGEIRRPQRILGD